MLREAAETADDVRMLVYERLLTSFPCLQGSTIVSAAHPLPPMEEGDDVSELPAEGSPIEEIGTVLASASVVEKHLNYEIGLCTPFGS